MTPQQERTLNEAREKIKELRDFLDGLMYNLKDGLAYTNDSEFQKVRKAYDLICQANDQI